METHDSTAERPAWLFDEFQDFGWSDPAEIEAYDRNAKVDSALERERVRQLGVAREHTVIDFGCGTGALVLAAAELCKRVVAVDVSAAMLAHVRAKAERSGLDNIDYVRQGVLTYRHQGAPADVVVSQRTLHHLPDFWKVQALQRMADTLRPGGTLFVRDILFSFAPSDAAPALEAWIGSRPEDGFPRAFFEKDIREEFITYTWLFEAMLEKVGFEIKDTSYGAYDVYAKYTCVKRPSAA